MDIVYATSKPLTGGVNSIDHLITSLCSSQSCGLVTLPDGTSLQLDNVPRPHQWLWLLKSCIEPEAEHFFVAILAF